MVARHGATQKSLFNLLDDGKQMCTVLAPGDRDAVWRPELNPKIKILKIIIKMDARLVLHLHADPRRRLLLEVLAVVEGLHPDGMRGHGVEHGLHGANQALADGLNVCHPWLFGGTFRQVTQICMVLMK
jgi:hypothetical protein